MLSTVTTPTNAQKTYWLGETFERSVSTAISTQTAGSVYGVILPMQSGSAAAVSKNWSYSREGFKEAKSGWFFAQDQGNNVDYQAENKQKLFRACSLHDGQSIQKEVVIAIENLKLPVNPSVYNWSTFTLKVLHAGTGLSLEEYANCDLNPASTNYLARKVGDQYQLWDETNRRYRTYGDNPNNSNYIRIEMESNVALAGPPDSTMLPFGFYGPVTPPAFTIASGSTKFLLLGGDHTDTQDPWVAGSGSVPSTLFNLDDDMDIVTTVPKEGGTFFSASFDWPSIPLRNSGSDGDSENVYRVYWGIRPNVTDASTIKDPDYVDYLRRWNTSTYNYGGDAISSDTKHSFIFSLDDIVVDTTNAITFYLSGSRKSGASYTATNGAGALLSQNVKQFVAPMYGGFDGLDILEKEPFYNAKLTGANTTNYAINSINRAISAVSDPELVPANLMLIPGVNKPIITNKLLTVCQSRKDCLAIIDLEGDYTPATEDTSSAENRIGAVSTAVSNLKTRNINNSYGCAFYPWVQVTDTLNSGERVWVPSSVAGFGAMAQSEARSEVWFAPAGFNRGGLGNLGGPAGPRVVQARQRLDSGDRDDLYEVNINPIATFPNEGVVVYGQKTLQQVPSALDRINVRRLLIYLKEKVGNISRNLLFDQNVSSTWARFKSQVEPLLQDVQSKFGITEYKLVLDDTTTTADLIDRNVMYAKIFLKPARAIEFIVVDFVITRSGAEFV